MKTFLWIFWPLAPGGTWQDRHRLAAYAALILLPLATAFAAWLLYGPSLAQVLHP